MSSIEQKYAAAQRFDWSHFLESALQLKHSVMLVKIYSGHEQFARTKGYKMGKGPWESAAVAPAASSSTKEKHIPR